MAAHLDPHSLPSARFHTDALRVTRSRPAPEPKRQSGLVLVISGEYVWLLTPSQAQFSRSTCLYIELLELEPFVAVPVGKEQHVCRIARHTVSAPLCRPRSRNCACCHATRRV